MALTYFLTLVFIVSLLYQGTISEEQQLQALEKKLQMLEQKLLDMENKHQQDKNKLIALENKHQQDKNKLIALENKQQQDENKLIALERKHHTESRKLHRTVNEVKDENVNSMEHIRVTKALFLDTIEKLDEFDSKVDDVKQKVDEVKQKVDKLGTIVAFTARMDGNGDHYRPTTTDPLPFSDVVYNEGGAYDSSSYTFTCPVTGVYFFGMSLHSARLRYDSSFYGNHSTAEIRHSRLGDVVSVYSRTNDPDHSMVAQAATSAVIDCNQGETVWVRPHYTSGNQFYSDPPDWPRCVFTGFLINTL